MSALRRGWQAARFIGMLSVSTVVCSLAIIAGRLLGVVDRVAPPCLSVWARSWFTGGGIRIEVTGAEHLGGRGGVLVGNHQSSLDIPMLMASGEGRVRFLAKRELFWLPFAGWAMWASRCVPVDRANARRTRASMDAAFAELARGFSHFVVFPEGTRSPDGAMLPWHRGTFNFARRTNAPVIPFALDGNGARMPKGALIPEPGVVRLEIGPPIPAEEAAAMDPDTLLRRCLAFTESVLARWRGTPQPA